MLFYMDAFGVRPRLRQMADRLAAAGYTVLVPNVLYRHDRAPLVELPERIEEQDRPALLASSPQATDGSVGVTGYCMGAGLALRTAGTYPHRVAAAGGFHGAGLASDAPDSPHLLAEGITADLYFAHADQDPAMPPEQIDRLDKALTAAGVRHDTEVYAGAQHGYTMADTTRYNADATERHWTALLDLFGRTLS
ncbi:hydrolase [Phytohabitans rumicis]|uniref:Hydrolase n=1 Tax=Phytohabitans rumicis TaxID=1076125 RepID=A0A6V8KU12_9ACTN|nr:hydrolase [Phytohabitans rumicis]